MRYVLHFLFVQTTEPAMVDNESEEEEEEEMSQRLAQLRS